VDLNMKKCPECDQEIDISNIEENELFDCPVCGCPLEFVKGEIIPSSIEGEDWGE
jgi:uncharacterized paraquat-inducible protein A